MSSTNAQVELPQYQCHKKVRAAKITGIQSTYDVEIDATRTRLQLGEVGGTVNVDQAFLKKHGPAPSLVGGYYVQYDDGYTSWSPAKAFEEGYARVSA